MYHCVEFGAVRVVILKVLHSFLNLCNTSEILVQSPRRPETQKSKNYDTADVFCIWSKSTNTSQKATAAPLSDDPVRVFGHVVVTDDVIHAGQSLVHVLLQTLQVLRLFVHWDDGVLQLHQATLERGQDGHLQGRENDFKNVTFTTKEIIVTPCISSLVSQHLLRRWQICVMGMPTFPVSPLWVLATWLAGSKHIVDT